MIEKVEGIVFREQDYGETSKILTVLTKEHGNIGILSKGCKTMKSELRSGSGKLSYGYFHIIYKEGKLSTLISIDVLDPWKNIKKDIVKISYASFLLDLTEQVEKQHPSLELFSLLIISLKKIEEGYDPMVITNILELKYLDYLGVMPIIDRCAICGAVTGITTLSSSYGGYLCRKCHKKERIVSEKTIKLLRMFYYVDIAKISKLEISDCVKKEINQFLDEYYDHYTGLYLKSKAFLNKIAS